MKMQIAHENNGLLLWLFSSAVGTCVMLLYNLWNPSQAASGVLTLCISFCQLSPWACNRYSESRTLCLPAAPLKSMQFSTGIGICLPQEHIAGPGPVDHNWPSFCRCISHWHQWVFCTQMIEPNAFYYPLLRKMPLYNIGPYPAKT